MRQTILMIEDEPDILLTNQEYLQSLGYRVLTAETLREAREHLEAELPDLILLDILLPDGSGLEFCQEVRARAAIPVLFLSCLADKPQVVEGLRTGGDDYMTKPYSFDELGARCEALLRRAQTAFTQAALPIRLGNLTLDPVAQRCYLNGRDVGLTPREFSLMMLFSQNVGKQFTARELYSAVWGLKTNDDLRTVRVHISHLRHKLRMDEGGRVAIRTEKRKYYRFLLS